MKNTQFKETIKKLKCQLYFFKKTDKSTIFIFAARRGGSTFLAQTIGTESGVWCSNEPLACFENRWQYEERMEWLPKLLNSQFFDLSAEQEKQVKKYIDALINGGIKHFGSCENPKFPLIVDRVLMKILNAPFLVDWFGQFQPSQVLFLTRHPAGQTISVLRNKWGNSAYTYFAKPEFLARYFSTEQIEFGQLILAEKSEWEKGILNWIIENYYGIYVANDQVLRITYEELTLNPEKTLSYLCEYLNLKEYQKLYAKSQLPSGSSKLSDSSTINLINNRNAQSLLEKWKTKVTEEEARQAQIILDKFEIDIYSMYETVPNSKYLINQS